MIKGAQRGKTVRSRTGNPKQRCKETKATDATKNLLKGRKSDQQRGGETSQIPKDRNDELSLANPEESQNSFIQDVEIPALREKPVPEKGSGNGKGKPPPQGRKRNLSKERKNANANCGFPDPAGRGIQEPRRTTPFDNRPKHLSQKHLLRKHLLQPCTWRHSER